MKSLDSKADSPPPTGAGGRAGASRRSWLATLILALSALLVPAFLHAADPGVELEYKIKAGYLFNFARFIEWPAKTLPTPKSPIIIGVLEGTEALPVIQQVLQDKTVNERPLLVKAVTSIGPDSDCHILFVCRTVTKSPLELRAALGSAATLVVGETGQFAEKGGMIGFVRQDESFRLRLNLQAATQSGLKVSAKLSNVAQIVKTKRDQ